MWVGALQKSLDYKVSESQVCGLKAFLVRELTGNKEVAGSPTEKLRF